MDKKLNGFNNGRDTTDGVGGGESLEENMKWCAENMEVKTKPWEFYNLTEVQYNDIVAPYKEIAFQMAKEATGKFLLMDVNLLPDKGSDFDIDKFLELAKEQKISLVNTNPPSIKEAIEVLCNALREDTTEGSYYYSWMCNIKMTMYDAVSNCTVNDFETGTDEKELLEACENGAKNFLNLLINK